MEHSPIISAGMMEIDERLMGRTGNRLMGEQAATMRTLDFMRHCFKQSTDGAEKRTLNTLIDFLATDLVRLEDLNSTYGLTSHDRTCPAPYFPSWSHTVI